jgi:hypothetical protein
MITLTAASIVARVKRLIPNRWFSWVAPNRDALLGGISDLALWSYNLVSYARAQSRLASAYGVWLDVWSFDFLQRFILRGSMKDDTFRAFIQATILQERVTRAGMINAITKLTGLTPWVFEPWNTYDTGAYSAAKGKGAQYGSMGYGVGQGGYGNMNLPGQAFIQLQRGSPSGIPGVGGYAPGAGNTIAGWGVGAMEYAGSWLLQAGITNALIYRLINITKPTGTIMWTAIGAPVRGVAKRPAIFNAKNDTQNIAII